jgi:ketosteroid isomerase-like protein
MITARRVLCRTALLAACLAALPFLAAPAVRAEEVMGLEEQGIRGLVKGFADHWKDGKQNGTIRLFAEDGVLIPPGGHPPVQGPDGMRDYWWPRNAPEREITRYEITPDEVGIELDLAYVRGRYVLEYAIGEEENRRIFRREGNWLAVVKRGRDTFWRLSRVMWDEAPSGDPSD